MARRWGGSRNQRFSQSLIELDDRVVGYLRKVFGEEPEHQDEGADYLLGKYRVEVKSTSEWIAAPQSNGDRRRGAFQFFGHEVCDFVLFVLRLGDDSILLSLVLPDMVDPRIGKGRVAVNWHRVFPDREKGALRLGAA